jgi:selenocysteine-specific elongation factor
MQSFIIGTAGHVDHGKSALAKALTGVDPDRLPEEKNREMTIDLGFVFFPVTDQDEAAIIDVPGHERFIKTMIAGANSVRMVLFVVAADEGVMPQTREHLDVLKLLNIEKGNIVITKVDKVDEEYVALVEDDVKGLVRGSFLERAPVYRVSSVSGKGIDELKGAITAYCKEIEPLPSDGIFRCPIDRIFSMKGFGAVVAGTVVSGRQQKTDPVEVLPLEQKARIRNLQVHNQSVSEVCAGQRAAFNLADVNLSDVFRGYELSIPDYLKPTDAIDAKLSLLSSASRVLSNNQRIRLHKGTSEVMARVVTFDKKEIQPGEQCFVRFKLERPVVAERKERFVIRSYSPMRVIGGGTFLEPYVASIRRGTKSTRRAYLEQLESTQDRDLVETVVLHAAQPIADEKELMKMTNLPLGRVSADTKRLLDEGILLKLRDSTLVHKKTLVAFKEQCITAVERYVDKNPLKVVMGKSELVKALRISRTALLDRILEDLTNEGKIEIRAEGIKKTGAGPKLSADAQKLSDAIEKYVVEFGFKPFRFVDITDAFPKVTKARIKNVFDYLYKNDSFTEITDGTYLHKQVLKQAKKKLLEHLSAKQTVRAIEYKEILGVSRNTARDILDYFFDHGVTIREKGTHRLAE